MSTPALELSGLKKSFGKAEIIRGIDLSIGKSERHAIIGPNGAGKSTLFNLITARFPATAGTVKLHGEDLAGLQPFQINRKGLSRSFQITNIFPAMSVFENVRCALLWSQGYKYSFWNLVNRSRALTETFMEAVTARNAGEDEFLQAVEEVAEDVLTVEKAHAGFAAARVLERLTEPDQMIQFRVVWEDDDGRTRINRGWRTPCPGVIPCRRRKRLH